MSDMKTKWNARCMINLEFVSLLLQSNQNTQSTPTAIYVWVKTVPSVKTFLSEKQANTATDIILKDYFVYL